MFTIESGDARLTVAPEEGGRIVGFSVGGYELLVPRDVNEHDFGCFPMAPWAGRIRHGRFTFGGEEYQLPLNKPPHAIHGTARDQAWEIVGDGVIATELGHPWPFGGRVVQRFALAHQQLELTMEVHAGEEPMPASCGWHPWWNRFPRDDIGLHLELRAGAMLEKDDEGIQTGELVDLHRPPWDDCFTALGCTADHAALARRTHSVARHLVPLRRGLRRAPARDLRGTADGTARRVQHRADGARAGRAARRHRDVALEPPGLTLGPRGRWLQPTSSRIAASCSR